MSKKAESKFVKITLEEAEWVVARNSRLSWEGWFIHEDIPNFKAFSSVQGVLKNGRWHKRNTYKIDEEGKYWIPKKYVDSNDK